ncbi:MAG: hypothetical protein ABIG10_02480 [bacterium]
MQTKHYIIENIAEFSEHTEAVKKLKEYLDCIDEVAFPIIEEIFGQVWDYDQINIKLDDSTGSASYRVEGNYHIVKMGIYNRNIQREYPKNLWGCLFHETHHAFLNPIIHNKRDGKIFNGGHKAEVFNYAFMATSYLKLKEKNKIDVQVYEHFLKKLERELDKCNREFRVSDKYEYERELPDNTMDIFQEYIHLFSMNIENFSKFISYLKSSDSVFTNVSNFRQDLDKAKEFLAN